MPRAAILTPNLVPGDAVSNDCFGMHDALVRRGFDATVFCANWDDARFRARPLFELEDFLRGRDDLLIYHFSMGWREGLRLLGQASCRRIVKHHGVTPPEFFDGWSEVYEDVCRAGEAELREIARMDCDLYLATSEFTAAELRTAGVEREKCFIVPPFHHIEDIDRVAPDFPVLDRYRDRSVTVLTVGRIFPNKNHRLLVEAFALYHHGYNPRSRCIMVGKESEHLASYTASLRRLAEERGVGESVIWTGGVSESELKAYYLVADIFLMTSEHEGFCVPLVEAMRMKIPIVALNAAAVPFTLDDVGIVWEEPSPPLFAGTINYLARNEDARIALGMLGWERYAECWTNERTEARLFEALRGVVRTKQS